MAVAVKAIIAPVQLGTGLTTLYTSTGVRTIIDKFTGVNTTAGAITVDVHLVPNGGSASATNKLVDGKSIDAHEVYIFPEVVGHVLEPGDFIRALASSGASVGIRGSGRVVT